MSQAGRSLNGVLASLAGIVAVCAALSIPAPAWAVYDGESTDSDIMKSCKEFWVVGKEMQAKCNEWTSKGLVTSVKFRTINLDEKIGVKDGALEYGQTKYSDVCRDMYFRESATQLKLMALCPAGSSEKLMGIRVDDRITNVGLTTETPGLYWSDTVNEE